MFINNQGHMTKMAAMPVYGKNHLKSSSPEPLDRFQRNFACSIGDRRNYYNVFIDHELWMTMGLLTARTT